MCSSDLLSRVLAGKHQPGPRLIAGLLTVFGVDRFDELFEIVEADA